MSVQLVPRYVGALTSVSAKVAESKEAHGVPIRELDEAGLCTAALAGQREAWDWLIARHNHRVVVSLLGRGLPIDRAQEVAQEAWARILEQQRLGRLQHLSLPGLALAQAGFLALDDLRRRQPGRAGGVDGMALVGDLPDPAVGIEERLLSREQLRRAQLVLSDCSSSAQRVFRLLYDNPSISHAEAAAEVGLSLQRVRQILCEVRKKLRVAMEE